MGVSRSLGDDICETPGDPGIITLLMWGEITYLYSVLLIEP